MKLTEDIKPVTYMKTRAAELLREVKRSRRPVVITQHGEAQAVVLDVATYEALRDATLLLKITAQGEADIQGGRTVSQAEAFARVRRRLANKE
ncbi:type II toxin-antitoxin system Phd/YefM family antitoxin [Archangium sp.]|uniref:type II toxin-antitoxin system Phd/YefM family antitoxin n=1 Tax=Archangium sp. TaxID=1872627 RepID=UPI00286BE10D|nr:type II toxin-antitoxin system Phd/YefM family antitoxin [Archangium sp.]